MEGKEQTSWGPELKARAKEIVEREAVNREKKFKKKGGKKKKNEFL